MSENTITSIAKMEPGPGSQAGQGIDVFAQHALAARPGLVGNKGQAPGSGETPPAVEAKAPKPKSSSASVPDIRVKFKIDDKTNDITILILDRSTQKVIRAIPPQELNKLDPGELLELFL